MRRIRGAAAPGAAAPKRRHDGRDAGLVTLEEPRRRAGKVERGVVMAAAERLRDPDGIGRGRRSDYDRLAAFDVK